MENNNLAPLFSRIAKFFAKLFGLYTLVQLIFVFLMPPAIWPLLLLELIGPFSATVLSFTWHKNMEEEIKEQHRREVMEHMKEEGYNVFVELGEEDDAEFYFENEEAMQSLIEKVIEAAKLKAEQEGIEFTDEEDKIEQETTLDLQNKEEQDKKVEHLGLIDDDDYPDYEQPRELIDDNDYEDDNSNNL